MSCTLTGLQDFQNYYSDFTMLLSKYITEWKTFQCLENSSFKISLNCVFVVCMLVMVIYIPEKYGGFMLTMLQL